MKSTLKLILIVPVILVFSALPVVHAQTSTATLENPKEVFCNDSPVLGEIYSPAQDPAQVDYYKISVLSGQRLIIDVDAETIGSTLDAFLEVLEPDGTPVDANNDQTNDPNDLTDDSLDPYLEIEASSDDVIYIIAISSGSSDPTNTDDSQNTGSYTLTLQCIDQSSSAEFEWPVAVGELLGATDSDNGSLIKISPENGASSDPFPLDTGPMTDTEFDPSSKLVFVAVDAVVAADDLGIVDYTPPRIAAFDPISGSEVASYRLDSETESKLVALEAAGGKLYGVQVTPGENFSLAQVTLDSEQKTAKLTDPVSFNSHLEALAYNQSEKVMYCGSGINLLKINLESSPSEIQTIPLTGLSFDIIALDFSDQDVLYGVDRSGRLFNVPDLSSAQAVTISDPIAGLRGLTFVLGEAPSDEEPIKTLCSSTFTSTIAASSETKVHRLSRVKLKKNPLHRAIGLFKFKGRVGEKVTLRLAPEGEEAAETVEEPSINTLFEWWLKRRGKKRVFLGLRDAIPNVDFRARKKDLLPFELSAVLPADGEYYVMVIRPLLRYYGTDYCLTLESDYPESEAWQSLDVVWPGDDSEEDTATTSTEAKTAELQSAEVYDEGACDSADTSVGETTEVVPALTSSEPVLLSSDSSTTESVVEGGSGQEVQAVKETTVAADTAEVVSAEEPAAEAIDEPAVMGAPAISEETTIEDTAEVAADESVDQVSEDSVSTDGSGSAELAQDDSDGAESAEGGTGDVVPEETTEDSAS